MTRRKKNRAEVRRYFERTVSPEDVLAASRIILAFYHPQREEAAQFLGAVPTDTLRKLYRQAGCQAGLSTTGKSSRVSKDTGRRRSTEDTNSEMKPEPQGFLRKVKSLFAGISDRLGLMLPDETYEFPVIPEEYRSKRHKGE